MKKVWKIGCALVAVLVIYALAVNFWVVGSGNRYILSPEDPGTGYDCIVVFGCLVNGDTPSDMLRDRLDRAVELYRAGVSERILLSGDHLSREGYDEVSAMEKYMLSQGIPEDAILRDEAGYSTFETACNVSADWNRVLLVTQPYHLYRAVYDVRRMGTEAYGVPAMPNRYKFGLYNTVREVLARNQDFLFLLSEKNG